MQILQTLAVLSFLSVGALSLGRIRYAWVKWTKWAKWGSIVVFSVAALFALILIMRWGSIRLRGEGIPDDRLLTW